MNRERVEPIPFDAAPQSAAPIASAQAPTAGAQRWVLPGLIALIAIALAVVFWLPGKIDQGTRSIEPAQSASADALPPQSPANAGVSSRPEAPAASPFADAQAARSRQAAQDILGELLDVREQLVLRGAESWAAEDMATITDTASAGDELYRQREFVAAIAQYERALAIGIELEGRLPQQLQTQLDLATAALLAGDAPAAEAALALAEQLEPGRSDVEALRRRLKSLPEVLAQMQAAADAEGSGSLAAAKRALEAAAKLDPAYTPAIEELARVSDALLSRNFTQAMSEGYAALDKGSFDRARKAFARAQSLVPGSGEAQAALQEVQVAETARKLQDLREEAQQQVDAESWQTAVESYEAALAIDNSLLFAQKGLQLAEPRARLDEQLRQTLDNPARLADDKVAAAAEQMLNYAQGIKPRGPLLAKQVNALEKLLVRARTPVQVVLSSDGQTEVTVLKVARLGQFTERALTMRPGDYVAVGTRRGFRDVRREFSVSASGSPGVISVTCTEPI